MSGIIVTLALTPPIAVLTGVFVGGITTLSEWIDAKIEANKAVKEQKKIIKERERLWELYMALPLE